MDLDDQLQKLVELTGRDPGPEQDPQMSLGVYQILNILLSSIIIFGALLSWWCISQNQQYPSVMFSLYEECVFIGPRLEPLPAPQPTFEHGGWSFSNCSLLHKLLITGQEEQVVSRRGELNRDLLSTTCGMDRISKVRCKIGLIKFLAHAGTKQHRNSNVQLQEDHYRLKIQM